jgi:imidazole glycerol-phosphate synthase subunit HisH
MIRIVDYGLGNINAFLSLYKHLGIEAAPASNSLALDDATHLILPGVGAFDHAVELLEKSGMRTKLEQMVHERKIPVLGICVGMQILAGGSDEGKLSGLNWIPGHVRSFRESQASSHLPMPHMGWNNVLPAATSPLFADFDSDPRFYFLHSFYFECRDSVHVSATADYGVQFACAVSNGHIHGVQCHPEKSHRFGMALLKNFARI